VAGSRVGTAFVNGDLLGQSVRIACTLQITPCCGLVSLGSEEQVHIITSFVYRTVQAFPLSGDFGLGAIHPPARSNWPFVAAKD